MMSKAKWFAARKPSTGATSANQIVPPKFRGPTKMLYYIHQTPFPFAVLRGGGWGRDYITASLDYDCVVVAGSVHVCKVVISA